MGASTLLPLPRPMLRLLARLRPTRARRIGHATARSPGADLGRLPVGLDLRGISVMEGVRAALASAVIMVAHEWIRSPLLAIAAFAAMLTCFCDTGGPISRRVPPLLSFAFLGALTWTVFGLLRNLGPELLLPAVTAVLFCNSFARIWGLQAQAVGNLLTVVTALALDRPLPPDSALQLGLAFLGGSLWAVVLTLVIWRIHPFAPARQAVSGVWHLLGLKAEDLRNLLKHPELGPQHWEAHARAHRRAVRAELEAARDTVVATLRLRGANSLRAQQNLLWLEVADSVFGTLIALSEEMEQDYDARDRARAGRMLRRLIPLLAVMQEASLGHPVRHLDRLDHALEHLQAHGAPESALQRIATKLADRLRIGVKIALTNASGLAPVGNQVAANMPRVPWRDRVLAPLRANLTWESAILRHATRAVAVTIPVIAGCLIWTGPFQHWLIITVALTVQPYFAATWQRALERIGGTVLGAAIGAALAFLPQSPLFLAGALFPLSIIGFSVRQVSFGAYIACLTPLVVVLVEVAEPGQSEWVIAAMRTLFALAGGLLAVGACMVLWPSWEPERLGGEVRAGINAYSRYAATVFAALAGEGGQAEMEAARRPAGVANNNLEAALSRALQEPRRDARGRLQAAMTADAALRRLGGTLLALQYDPPSVAEADRPAWHEWREWAPAALAAIAAGRQMSPRPAAAPAPVLTRLAQQIELLQGALRRF